MKVDFYNFDTLDLESYLRNYMYNVFYVTFFYKMFVKSTFQ